MVLALSQVQFLSSNGFKYLDKLLIPLAMPVHTPEMEDYLEEDVKYTPEHLKHTDLFNNK